MNKIIKYLTLFLILSLFDIAVYSLEDDRHDKTPSSWFCCFPFFKINYEPLNTVEEIPLTPPPYQTELEEQKAIKAIMDQCESITYKGKIDSGFYIHLSCQGIARHKQTLIVALSLGLLVDRPSLRNDPYSQFNCKTDFCHSFLNQTKLAAPSEDYKHELLDIFWKFHKPVDHHLLGLDSFDQITWSGLVTQVLAVYSCFPPRLSIMDIFSIVSGSKEYQGWRILKGEDLTLQFNNNIEEFCDYFDKQDEEYPRWKQTAQHKHIVAGPVTLYGTITSSQFLHFQVIEGDLVIEYSVLNPLKEGYEKPPLSFYLVKSKPEVLKIF